MVSNGVPPLERGDGPWEARRRRRKGIDIRSGANRLAGDYRLFGSHVIGRSQYLSGDRWTAQVRRSGVAVCELGHAEVGNLRKAEIRV